MRIRATKTWTANDDLLEARMRRGQHGPVLYVDGVGPISPVDFHIMGYMVVEAREDEIEELEEGGYRDSARRSQVWEFLSRLWRRIRY